VVRWKEGGDGKDFNQPMTALVTTSTMIVAEEIMWYFIKISVLWGSTTQPVAADTFVLGLIAQAVGLAFIVSR